VSLLFFFNLNHFFNLFDSLLFLIYWFRIVKCCFNFDSFYFLSEWNHLFYRYVIFHFNLLIWIILRIDAVILLFYFFLLFSLLLPFLLSDHFEQIFIIECFFLLFLSFHMLHLIYCLQSFLFKFLLINLIRILHNLLIGGWARRWLFLLRSWRWLNRFHRNGFKSICSDKMSPLIDSKCRLWFLRSCFFDHVASFCLIFVERAQDEILHIVFLLGFDHAEIGPFFVLCSRSFLACHCVRLLFAAIGALVAFIIWGASFLGEGWGGRPGVNLCFML